MRRRTVVSGAVVVLAGLVAIGSAAGGGGASGPDAKMSATLAGNVKESFATDAWYPTLQQANGLPNVEVVASTAFVFTNIAATDLGRSNASTICHDVAAVTNDPTTAKPLGIAVVEVDGGSGQDKLATCDVP